MRASLNTACAKCRCVSRAKARIASRRSMRCIHSVIERFEQRSPQLDEVLRILARRYQHDLAHPRSGHVALRSSELQVVAKSPQLRQTRSACRWAYAAPSTMIGSFFDKPTYRAAVEPLVLLPALFESPLREQRVGEARLRVLNVRLQCSSARRSLGLGTGMIPRRQDRRWLQDSLCAPRHSLPDFRRNYFARAPHRPRQVAPRGPEQAAFDVERS